MRLFSLPLYVWYKRPLLLLLILGMLTNKWAPISAGLVLVLGTARILDFLKRRQLRQRDNRRPSLIAMAVGFAAGGLSRAALYVSVGIGFVACVQFALWAHSQSITPEEALRGEQYLASIFPTVSNILSLRDYLAFLSVCVLVNLVLPFSGLVHKVLYIRSALSVLVFILIGVLSFSFFASDSAKFQITEWRKAEYTQARLALDDIKKINRETMAALWLEKQVKQADPATIQDYKAFFQSVNALRLEGLETLTDHKSEIVRDAARSVADNAPKAENVVEGASSVSKDAELTLLEAKMQQVRKQTFAELRQNKVKLTAAKARYEAVKQAALEAAVEVLADFIPASERPLVQAFVSEVSSTVGRNALEGLSAYFSPNTSAAKAWVENVRPVEATRAAEWKIAVRPAVAAKAGVSSEMAMTLMVAKLQTDAVKAAEAGRVAKSAKGAVSIIRRFPRIPL